MELRKLIESLVLFIFSEKTFSATIDDADKWHSDFLQNYTKNVRPIYNQSSAVQVFVFLYIKSIQEFDEVNEKFAYTAALQLFWHDYRLQWAAADYGGLSEVTVSYSDVWVPEMTLSTPASKSTSIGSSTDRIRIYNSGITQWMPAGLIESTCSVNVKYYPFDTQNCTTTFMSLGYKNFEVTLTAGSSKISFDVYSPNALWDVIDSDVYAVLLGNGGESEINFSIKIKRRASYVVINVVVPIFVLSILNVFVFVLVPESGERIGYCVTTLLAIAVYMTIVSDLLPQTSNPVPIISYKLMVDMFESACIVIVTIINLRFAHRDDAEDVPQRWRSVYRACSCFYCRKRNIHPQQTLDDELKQKLKSENNMYSSTPKKDKKEAQSKTQLYQDAKNTPITWKKISNMIDVIAFITFLSISLTSFTVFITLTRLGS